ncbi:unnamed protein product [Pleuronectes platessa]|uniref:Uncharacterized protein n=1 Tax=Pleuronectes platessa TaxID=8262 RepID=A0A9N7UB79_PLEPL|nr:unnamed protein product [Pleuronectes platessa]
MAADTSPPRIAPIWWLRMSHAGRRARFPRLAARTCGVTSAQSPGRACDRVACIREMTENSSHLQLCSLAPLFRGGVEVKRRLRQCDQLHAMSSGIASSVTRDVWSSGVISGQGPIGFFNNTCTRRDVFEPRPQAHHSLTAGLVFGGEMMRSGGADTQRCSEVNWCVFLHRCVTGSGAQELVKLLELQATAQLSQLREAQWSEWPPPLDPQRPQMFLIQQEQEEAAPEAPRLSRGAVGRNYGESPERLTGTPLDDEEDSGTRLKAPDQTLDFTVTR